MSPACSLRLESRCFHSCVTEPERQLQRDRAHVTAHDEAEMLFNDVTVVVERLTCSPLVRSGSPSGAHTHIRACSSRVKRAKASRLAPINPAEEPTDGDVEAVDAEGGTPTLPEALLLGVGFHGSTGSTVTHSHLFFFFFALMLVNQSQQCRSSSVPVPLPQDGKKKKMQISDFA